VAGNVSLCTFDIAVQSPAGPVCNTIAGLIAVVEDIPLKQGFSLGRRNSMVKKLQAAQRSVDLDRLSGARLQLDGFIRNCRILRDFNRLDAPTANYLILCASQLKAHVHEL
jgi:hypothetical protein